jgi:hypothetical protein
MSSGQRTWKPSGSGLLDGNLKVFKKHLPSAVWLGRNSKKEITMERLPNETIEQLETRLWNEHKNQASAARAATSVAFFVEGSGDKLIITGGAVVSNYNPIPESMVRWNQCPKCGGEGSALYPENFCCACDSERNFAKADIEKVQDRCILAMDRDPSTNIPVSTIDTVKWVDGGWDIHCDNGWNHRLGRDGHLYEKGRDA